MESENMTTNLTHTTEDRMPDPRRFWTRLFSRGLQFSLDLLVLMVAFVAAYLLRFEFSLSDETLHKMLVQLPLVLLIQFGALFLSGVYSFIWRYVGLADLWAFLKAICGSGLLLIGMRLTLPQFLAHWQVPLSIILMDLVFAFAGVVALRVMRRVVYERYEKQRSGNGLSAENKKLVVLVGAGRAGVLVAKEIQGRGDMGLKILGFVDDDEQKQDAVIQGIRVMGKTRDLPQLCREHDVDHVIITMAQASRRQLKRIIDICEKTGIKTRIIPGLYEIVDGRVEVSSIRDVEIEDLLGREPVQLEQEKLGDFLGGKTVVVTGAGGSIGSEMSRQVARFGPGELLLLERAEFALFAIDRELKALYPQLKIVPLVADVGDETRIRSLMAEYQPDVVFHAAAHKHVPMMERNPTEAITNNIFGTRTIGEVAGEMGVEAFVMISTDKAVNPTSVMGASKRVAELVVQELNSRYSTRYVAVRFGNVMGSAGSVIPIFREQIQNGGPVTVTHPDMVRYFMTIPEASQLVLQAGAMGEGGEIFILDMGDPVRILDLATDMISLSGLSPYEDIDIVFSGIRPGEKLYEELQTLEENATKTRHPKIFIGKMIPYPSGKVESALRSFHKILERDDAAEIRRCFTEILPEARFSSIGEDRPVGARASGSTKDPQADTASPETR